MYAIKNIDIKLAEDIYGNMNREYRCKHCHKLLFIGWFIGKIEIKCSKCKNINLFDNKKQ